MTVQQQMSKRFAAAKWCWATIIMLHVLLLAGPFVSAATSSRPAAIAVGLGVLVIPPVAFLLKWKAEEHYRRGEEVRRMLFLQDSVGQEVPENERLLIESESPLLPALEPACIGTYYASQSAPGLPRLVENLHESSFYTRRLASVAARLHAGACVLGISVIFVALWLHLQVPLTAVGDWATAERLARLFAEVFSFFAAGLFADMWLVYAGLAKSADRVFRNCAALKRKADPDAGVVYAELAEYDCALAAARPIPGWLKWLLGKGLASAWAKCSGSGVAIAGRTGS